MEWTADQLRVFRRALSEIYPREFDQRRFVANVSLPATQIAFDAVAENTFFDVLQKAKNAGKLDALLAFVLATEEGRDNEVLKRLQQGASFGLVEGPKVTQWHGPANVAQQLEKIIGQRSTLVPVRYLSLGLERAAAVAKVEHPNGTSGSGFLVAGNLLVTNHHVIESADEAKGAVARFDHEEHRPGLVHPGVAVRFDPSRFFKTSAEDDWTIVALAEGLGGDRKPIPVAPRTVAAKALVNIIQHPLGGPKMLSIEPRIVAYVGGGRLQYLTDTQPGSSGSPVFDQEWNLVGLHHSGGWVPEPGGDGSRTWYRNEGILVERFLPSLPSA